MQFHRVHRFGQSFICFLQTNYIPKFILCFQQFAVHIFRLYWTGEIPKLFVWFIQCHVIWPSRKNTCHPTWQSGTVSSTVAKRKKKICRLWILPSHLGIALLRHSLPVAAHVAAPCSAASSTQPVVQDRMPPWLIHPQPKHTRSRNTTSDPPFYLEISGYWRKN